MKLLPLLLGLLFLTGPVVAQQPQTLYHFTVSITANELLTPVVRSYATRALRSIPDIRIDSPADEETDYKLALSVLEIRVDGELYGYAVHHYFAHFGVKRSTLNLIRLAIKDLEQCITQDGKPLTDFLDLWANGDASVSIASAGIEVVDKNSLEDVIRRQIAKFDGEHLEKMRQALDMILKNQ